MKKAILFMLLIIPALQLFSQGWKDGQMQVIIYFDKTEDVLKLHALKLDMDYYKPGDHFVRAYIVQRELEQVQSLGFNYEIEIPNLLKQPGSSGPSDDAYHTYTQMIALIDSLATNFPSICKKYLLGTSLGSRQLTSLKISDNVAVDENQPEIIFDAGIHGDEAIGPEITVRFARALCLKYGTDPTVTNLVNNREIWLYIMVNPDGFAAVSRYNNNGIDLNRDYGYMWNNEGGSASPFSQVETKVLRNLMYQNQFVVHTTYHSGTEFISYPWSYRPDPCPDNTHINYLAALYSTTSGYAAMPYDQGYNGMYPINGSTKDGNYGIMGCVTWSLELSNIKKPSASQIQTYYNYNYPSMIMLIEQAGKGLQGMITSAATGQPVPAAIFVNNYYPTYNDPAVGDYHKYLLPGTYTVKVVANGHQTQTIPNVVIDASGTATLNVQMQPLQKQFVYRLAECSMPANNFSDEGFTPAVIGPPDNVNYSIGKSGWVVLDMQFPVPDGAGPDIRVIEGDATAEGYTCYVSGSQDGPWYNLGTGSGTASFDIALSGLEQAQFIKILDDGDGGSTGADIGFDLDAVEKLDQTPGVYLALTAYSVNDAGGNNNGKIDPGETVLISTTLKNNGNIDAVIPSGTISTLSPYITLVNANAVYGTILPGESQTATYTVMASPSTPAGTPLLITLDVVCNGGLYMFTFNMNFIIGQIPVLVVDLDDNKNSGPVIKTSVEANGVGVDYSTSFPTNPAQYSAIFLCLGIYPNNHVLTSTQGQTLATYLNNGGRLFMEGGDTWAYDSQTAVHSMFKISPAGDGSGDMNTLLGQVSTFTEGMTFVYGGENSYMDRLNPISPAVTVLKNQSPSYGTAIINDGGIYRTIGTSHEFGGLTDGTAPSTKTELMWEYLNFFGVLPPPPPPESKLQVKAFLQGPFNGTGMNTFLNSLGELPLSQPFISAPWNYTGTESVASIPNTSVTDWILVELRESAGGPETATSATMIARQAGFILSDGNIVSSDGTSLMEFNITVTGNLYVVIWHRNHIPVISGFALTKTGDTYTYDFSTSADQALGGASGHRNLAAGIWGMAAGDGDADGQVANGDKMDVWAIQAGQSGYKSGDFSLNGSVDNNDKIQYWSPNAGFGTQVP